MVLRGSYSASRGGFVTSTGKVYPTRNPSFVPKGYTSTTTSTGGVTISGGKVTSWSSKGITGTTTGGGTVPGTTLTANQLINQTRQQALTGGQVSKSNIGKASFTGYIPSTTSQTTPQTSPSTSTQQSAQEKLYSQIGVTNKAQENLTKGIVTSNVNQPSGTFGNKVSNFFKSLVPKDYSQRQNLPSGQDSDFILVTGDTAGQFSGKQSSSFVITSQAKNLEELRQEQEIVKNLGAGIKRPNYFAMTEIQEKNVLERKRDIESYTKDFFAAQRKTTEIQKLFQQDPTQFKEALTTTTLTTTPDNTQVVTNVEYTLPKSYFENLPEFKNLEKYQGDKVITSVPVGAPVTFDYTFKGLGGEGLKATETWQSKTASFVAGGTIPTIIAGSVGKLTGKDLSSVYTFQKGTFESALVSPVEHPVKTGIIFGAAFAVPVAGAVGLTYAESIGYGTAASTIGTGLGYAMIPVYGGVLASNIASAKGAQAKGEVLGASLSTELAPALVGGYFGSKLGSYLTTPQITIGKSKLGEPVQMNVGDTIRTTKVGRVGESDVFTVQGKGVYKIPSETPYTIETTKLQKFFGIKSTSGVLDTSYYQGVFLGKNVFRVTPTGTPNMFKFYGSGIRTVETVGYYPVQTGKYTLGTNKFWSENIQGFRGGGTGKSFDFTELTRVTFGKGSFTFKPLEVTTITTPYMSFGKVVPSTFTQVGKPFGEGISGRPSGASGFEMNIRKATVTTSDRRIEFGESTAELRTTSTRGKVFFKTESLVPEKDFMNIQIDKNFVPTEKYPSWLEVTKTPRPYTKGEFDYLGTGGQTISQTTQQVTKTPSFTGARSLLTSTKISTIQTTSTTQTQIGGTKLFTLTAPITISSTKTITRLLTPQLTASRTTLSPAIIPSQLIEPKITSGLGSGSVTSLVSETVVTTPTVPPIIMNPPISTPSPPFIPYSAPFVPFVPILPKLNFDFGIGTRRIKGKKQRKKYTPDYPSLVLGRRGKAPKTFTGLERRPIPKGFKFEFGRIKF